MPGAICQTSKDNYLCRKLLTTVQPLYTFEPNYYYAMKKTLHALASFAALFTFPFVGHSQDGSTCDSGIVLYPTDNYDYSEHTTSSLPRLALTSTSRLKHRNTDWMCLISIPYNYSPEAVPDYIKWQKTNCRIIQKPNI